MQALTDKLKGMLTECSRATPGPWIDGATGKSGNLPTLNAMPFGSRLYATPTQDEKFIASARTHLPAALRALIKAQNILLSLEQFCTWLGEDSNKYPGTDAGTAAISKRADIRKAIAEIEKEFQ